MPATSRSIFPEYTTILHYVVGREPPQRTGDELDLHIVIVIWSRMARKEFSCIEQWERRQRVCLGDVGPRISN